MNIRNPKLSIAISTALLLGIVGGCSGDNPEKLIASGKEFLAKNDSKGAVIQLKNALQKNPDLGEARFLLGKALLESGDGAGAVVELTKALKLKYSADEVVPVLAQALLATGQAKKLIEDFGDTSLSANEAQASLKTTLSAAYATQGNRESAQRALEAAFAVAPDYQPALLTDARIKAANRNFDEAQAIIDKILSKNPKNHEALMLDGAIAGAKGDNVAAVEFYRKAIEAKSDYLPAHWAIITNLYQQKKPDEANKALEALKKIAPKHPRTLYLEAQAAYQRSDYAAARELIQQVLKASPNNPDTLQLAGAIEFQSRSYIQAETYLNKALQATPGLDFARKLLATIQLRTGQPAKALATLQPVLDKISQDAALLSLAGEAYLQSGDANKAAEYFSKASKLEPNDPTKKTSLAMAHMAQGNTAGAFGELEQISLSDSGVAADLALISSHLRNNEFDQALKAIDTLEKKQPDNPATYNLRARALLAKKDVPGARKSFEKALSINPAFFPAAASLAALDLADKKPDEARKRFDSVLAADPKNTSALLAMAELRANTGGNAEEVSGLINKAITTNPTDSTPRLALIQYYLNLKDTKKAIAAANDAAAAFPDKPEILEALGRTQQVSGDLNQALTTFGKLASLQPLSPAPHMRLAEINLANKNKDEAQKSLKRALEIKPDLIEAQRAMIALAIDANRPADALGIARQVQKQRPKEETGFTLEGDIDVAQKKWPDAILAYRSAIRLAPASPELGVKLNTALLSSGNAAEAEKMAAAWLKDHPKDALFRLHLGDTATSRKDYAQAAQHYHSALEIQPDNPLILNNLAWVSGELKSPKAIEYAEKANQLAPNQPPFMDTLAMLLAQKGESAKAIELLRKAIGIAPQAALIQLNLAKVLIGAGQKDAARKELDSIAKLGDKFPAQAEVARLQKEL